VGRISTKIGNLGAIFEFWIFWVLGSGFWELFWISQNPLFWRANFPEPSRISQNPKKPVCLRKRRTQHDYIVLCHLRIQRSTHLRRVVLLALRGSFELLCCCSAESNISFQIIILNFSNGEYLHFLESGEQKKLSFWKVIQIINRSVVRIREQRLEKKTILFKQTSQLQPIQVGYSIPVFYVSHTPLLVSNIANPLNTIPHVRVTTYFFASESLFSYPYNYHILLSILCMYLFSLHLYEFFGDWL
jgi:hypothetical protein